MGSALDTVAFLAQSENRVAVLEALAENPRSRRELLDELSFSRVTLGRILREFEARNWIVRSGQRYELTPLGALVISELRELLEAMDTELRLREVMEWFPVDQVPFDIRCLRDAEIVVPSTNNLTAHVQRVAECYRDAERARVLTYQVGLPILEATWEATVENDQRFEGILAPGLIETLTTDSEMASLFSEMLDEPAVDFYAYAGEIPVMFFITDATVGIALSDDEEIAKALILTDDDAVYDWGDTTFDAYRETSTPVSPDAPPT